MAELIRDKGDVARLTVTYALTSGTFIDPSVVALRVRTPTLITFTPTPLQSSTGHYYADITLYESGVWTYKWTSTGTGAGTEEGVIFARPTTN